MASDYIQDLAFQQISQAIMATANSVGSSATGNDVSSGESSIFGVMRRKWGKVQDVIQGIAAPLKRRSMYDELPEHVWPSEQIEMSQIPQRGLGHNFIPCNLTNPTWCDYCGDFIWGVYKQCLRCQTCQYTCHQHCVPAVTLNCKSISDDGVEVTVPKTPTPTEPRPQLETSLSLGNINARPGCARNVTISSPKSTDLSAVTAHHSSDYPPQTQGGGYDSGVTPPRGGSNVYAGVYHGQSIPPSSNLTLSSNTLPRSVSEGYVTAHLSPQQGPTVTAPRTSQGFSSPYSTPPSANIDPGSNPSSTLQRPNIQSSLLSPVISCEDKVGSSDQVTQENSSSSHDISSYNRSGAEGPLPQHTLLTDRENNPDETTEKDETDSGYRSGTIPDDKLPRIPSQETLDLQELKRKIAKFNHFVPAATLELTDKESFQGFVKVTMNLIRPITMELGARPPSIYELLTREHIIEENTQQVAFYMPRDTHKSLHITSETTTKEVVTSLLKKFHILDHPRKFAMYEQEFSDRNKLVRLRRLTDKDFPLRAILTWNPERIKNYRMVLQENETGEIVWDAFSLPELGNFLKVLDREEKETILELKHKYAYMKQYMERRLAELRNERNKQGKSQK